MSTTVEEICRYARAPKNGLWIDTVANIGDHVLRSRPTVSRGSEATTKRGPTFAPEPAQALEKRIDGLIDRMTLEEKVGQMNMPCVYEGALGESIPDKMAACRQFAQRDDLEGLGPPGGFCHLP